MPFQHAADIRDRKVTLYRPLPYIGRRSPFSLAWFSLYLSVPRGILERCRTVCTQRDCMVAWCEWLQQLRMSPAGRSQQR